MKYIILLVLAICTYSSYAQNVTNMNVTNMNITDANITSVFGKGKAGKKKNATISPLSEKFCTSKEVDPKKKDLCYSAQFVMVESEKYFTKLKELEQPQKIYTDLREETVQALQRATAQIRIVKERLIEFDSPINIGRSFRAIKEGINRAITNISDATTIRETMVALNGPRDLWVQNVKDARDEHEKYWKYLELFRYHNKVELEAAKKKVAHLENITIAKTKELKEQLDHAERMALKNKDFVSNPDVDDEAGALALQSMRRSTSNAAATKRYLLAIEAELKLARLTLDKIKMRTPGAGLPVFPDIKPTKNYGAEDIDAIKDAQIRLDEKANKEFHQLKATSGGEFDVIASLPGAPKKPQPPPQTL